MKYSASAEGPRGKGDYVDGHQGLLVDLCGILHLATRALMIRYGHERTVDVSLGQVTYTMPPDKIIRVGGGWGDYAIKGPSQIVEKYTVRRLEKFLLGLPGAPKWQPETEEKKPDAVEVGVRVRWPRQYDEESLLWISSGGEADLGGSGFEGITLSKTQQLVGATAFAAIIRQKAVAEGLGPPLPEIPFDRINEALESFGDGEWTIEHAKQHKLEIPAELTGYTGTV